MKRRWPVLAGLLAGGAAVGAAAAIVLRRRRQWEGYEPDEELDLAAEPRGADEGPAGQAPEAGPPPVVPDHNQVRDAARAASGGE